MLIASAFAHFSSELFLKEQVFIPVKKMLNNAGHIDAKLIDFSESWQKKSSEIGCFLLIVSWRSFPQNFPWNRPSFSRICPWKSLEIWLFSAKIQRNWPIFPRILTFFPWNSCEIGRFFRKFAPENPAKFCFFPREISEALYVGQHVCRPWFDYRSSYWQPVNQHQAGWSQPTYRWRFSQHVNL